MEQENILKDSIRSAKLAIATQEMDYRYQTKQKEATINELTKSNRLKTFLAITSLIAAFAIMLLFYNRKKHLLLKEAYYTNREQILQQQAEIAEQKIHLEEEAKEKAILSQKLKEEENLKLQKEIENTNRELLTTAIYIKEKNKVLEHLQQQVNQFLNSESGEKRKLLLEINNNIKKQLSFEKDWEKIKLHFDKVHPDFFEKLSKQFPALTQKDLKNCAYIKMKLNHKDIANLTGLDYNSVKMARYRIKKKLNLQQDEDLNNFIDNFT